MSPFRDRVVPLPSGEGVRVREWDGEGIPVLLIHGFLGGVEEWGDLPEALHGRQVTAVDLPGHGRSAGSTDPHRYQVPRVARDLANVQESLFGKPAIWVGYSMGGRIALSAAVEGVPMRALLLEGASPGIRDARARRKRQEEDELRARRMERDGAERFVDWWLGLPLFAGLARLPGEMRESARRMRAGQDPARMAAWLRGGGTGSQPSYWDDLSDLRIPVRILVGEDDAKFRRVAADMAAHLPDAVISVAPGAGHLPHLEAPEVWLAWVQESG